MSEGLDDLVERLADERAGVRRVAALDVAADADRLGRDRALGALAAHLERGEADERVALTIIRALADARHEAARPVLRRLYEEAGTPVRVAHAAMLAHDQIELGAGGAPVESADGHDA